MSTVATAFLSHSSQDAALARQLCDRLEAGGVRCWIAPRDIPPGQSWAQSIVEGIEGCAAFVLLATTTSVLSRDVLIELERAHRLARPIYTVMVDQPRLTGEMTYYLTRLQWLESSRSGIDGAASRLAEVLNGTRPWEAVATPPSLGRRIRATLPSFAGSLAALLLFAVLLGGGGWYGLHRVQHAVAMDYRSIGWTSFDDAPMREPSGPLAVGHLWLGDPATHVALHVRLSTTTGADRLLDLSAQLPRENTRDAEFTLPLAPDVNAFTTFLAVPRKSEVLCVTQQYTASDTQLTRNGTAKVSVVPSMSGCS